jgi:hypothetical protein
MSFIVQNKGGSSLLARRKIGNQFKSVRFPVKKKISMIIEKLEEQTPEGSPVKRPQIF